MAAFACSSLSSGRACQARTSSNTRSVIRETVSRGKAASRGPARGGAGCRGRRARIVLLAASDVGNSEIARRLGTCADTARKWRRRYCRNGMDGLADAPRAGRPRAFPATVVAGITALACEMPAESETPLARWTCPELARTASMAAGTAVPHRPHGPAGSSSRPGNARTRPAGSFARRHPNGQVVAPFRRKTAASRGSNQSIMLWNWRTSGLSSSVRVAS